MKESTKKWIEAGKLIAQNVTAKVECPECGFKYLTIKDEFGSRGPVSGGKYERWLICESCSAENAILMTYED